MCTQLCRVDTQASAAPSLMLSFWYCSAIIRGGSSIEQGSASLKRFECL